MPCSWKWYPMQVINALIVELLNVLFTNLATWLTEPLLHWNVVMLFGRMLIGVLKILMKVSMGSQSSWPNLFTCWKIRLFEMTKILVDVWFWAGLTGLFSRIERIIGPTQSMPITSWSLAQRGLLWVPVGWTSPMQICCGLRYLCLSRLG